jgi:hypothetical protein
LLCWGESKIIPPLWKTLWRILKKLNIDLPYDPAIPLLGIYPKNATQVIQKAPAYPCLLQHLFTVAKLWKQPRFPTTNGWVKKMWYLYTIKFYSATKENEFLSFASK